MYVIVIQLRDPRTHAIEFVLKDARRDTWFSFEIHFCSIGLLERRILEFK